MKTKLYILLLMSLFTITSCMDDTYDLSNGINTAVTIGGDSLTMPILNTMRISVDTMMTKQDIEMLRQMEDSTYSFNLTDSMSVNMNYLSPVKFSFVPISIAPVSANFSNVKFPSFQIAPVNLNTTFQMPDFSIEKNIINPIIETYTQKFSIQTASASNVLFQSRASNVKTELYNLGPLGKNITRTIGESVFIDFPDEIKKINSIKLANCKVTLTFDKTKTNMLGFNSQSDTIKNFRIDFPSEFKLSTPVGMNSRIEGSSFIIDNAALIANVNVFTATFIIENLDLSQITQNGALSFDKVINYSLNYIFWGQIDNLISLLGKDVEYTVGLNAVPIIDDVVFETNPMALDPMSGQIEFNKTIDNLPTEISEIHSLSFENGAELQLNINNPGLSPFSLSAGVCQVNLPKSLIFKPMTGLNTTTNILSIPYNELFELKSLGLSGMIINKTIPEGTKSISIVDNLSYSLTGFTIGSTETNLKTIEGLTDKNILITGSCNNLTVKDALLTTRQISIDIPQKTTEINISKFVSTDVKKIYSATLKTPVSATFKINVSNLPTSMDSVFFENYTIKLPTCLKFSNGNVNSSNELVLNEGFKVSEGFTKTLTLESFNFGTTGIQLESGMFNFSEAVTMLGKVYVKGADLNTSDLESVEIRPAIQVGEMTLAVVETEIKPTIEPIVKNMLMNFPAYLMQDSTKLDLQNPVITLEIANSVGVAVDAAIQIIPKRNGVEIPAGIVTCNITIAAAVSGETALSKYWISKSNEYTSSNYTQVIIPNLPDLMKIVPDEIEIVVTPVISGDRQTVDLTSLNNKLDIKYNVDIPLDFGENFNIHFNDTVSNLKSQLKELIKLTNKIELIAIVDNTIPMNLEMELIPMDSLGQVLSGISVKTSDILNACNIDGSSQRSILEMTITEDAEGFLEELDAIKINVSATKTNTIAGLPLKTNQYFDLELRIRIPDGITLVQTVE